MGSWADDVEQEEQKHMVSSWEAILQLSKNRDTDKFNDRGINVSAQHRRQILEPWVLVDRSKQRPEDELDITYESDEYADQWKKLDMCVACYL